MRVGRDPEVEAVKCIGNPRAQDQSALCPFAPVKVVVAPMPKVLLGVPWEPGTDPFALVIVSVCGVHLAAAVERLSDVETPEVLPIQAIDEVERLAEEDFPGAVWRMVPAAAA